MRGPSEGTPQGAVVSPLLANIYLHYVYDLCVEEWRERRATGEVIVIRYADDTIVGFQRHADAERFLHNLPEPLATFGLDLHPEKTRLIELGRFAVPRRSVKGLGKPDTFDFLGFTHICGKRQDGKFILVRQTITKRMRDKLRVMSVMCGCPLRVKVDELRRAGEHGCGHVSGL